MLEALEPIRWTHHLRPPVEVEVFEFNLVPYTKLHNVPNATSLASPSHSIFRLTVFIWKLFNSWLRKKCLILMSASTHDAIKSCPICLQFCVYLKNTISPGSSLWGSVVCVARVCIVTRATNYFYFTQTYDIGFVIFFHRACIKSENCIPPWSF